MVVSEGFGPHSLPVQPMCKVVAYPIAKEKGEAKDMATARSEDKSKGKAKAKAGA